MRVENNLIKFPNHDAQKRFVREKIQEAYNARFRTLKASIDELVETAVVEQTRFILNVEGESSHIWDVQDDFITGLVMALAKENDAYLLWLCLGIHLKEEKEFSRDDLAREVL